MECLLLPGYKACSSGRPEMRHSSGTEWQQRHEFWRIFGIAIGKQSMIAMTASKKSES
jgi:hypothetical protein